MDSSYCLKNYDFLQLKSEIYLNIWGGIINASPNIIRLFNDIFLVLYFRAKTVQYDWHPPHYVDELP